MQACAERCCSTFHSRLEKTHPNKATEEQLREVGCSKVIEEHCSLSNELRSLRLLQLRLLLLPVAVWALL